MLLARPPSPDRVRLPPNFCKILLNENSLQFLMICLFLFQVFIVCCLKRCTTGVWSWAEYLKESRSNQQITELIFLTLTICICSLAYRKYLIRQVANFLSFSLAVLSVCSSFGFLLPTVFKIIFRTSFNAIRLDGSFRFPKFSKTMLTFDFGKRERTPFSPDLKQTIACKERIKSWFERI